MDWFDADYRFPVIVIVATGFFLGLMIVIARRVATQAPARRAPRDSDSGAEEAAGSTLALRVLSVLRTVLVLAIVVFIGDLVAQSSAGMLPSENTIGFRLRAWMAVTVLASALLPASRPSLRRIATGTLFGIAASLALIAVWVFSLGNLWPLVAVLGQTAVAGSVMSVVAAAGAGLISGALLWVGRLVRDGGKGRIALAGAVGAALLLAAGIGLVSRKPAVDLSYQLKPSFWRGEMSYGARRYPFFLVVERVDVSGQFTGYMDWAPADYVLKIEGKATGNHLVFEDTAFIKGQAETGVFDRKDVRIKDDVMTGTDKNGRATLWASLVQTPAPTPPAAQAQIVAPAPAPRTAEARLVAPEPPAQAEVAPPAKPVPQYPQIASPEPAPRTELTMRTERLCKGITSYDDRYTASCWTTLALESRRSTYCDLIRSAEGRAACFSLVSIVLGDPAVCHAHDPEQLESCVFAAAAAKGQDMCDAALPAEDTGLRAACRVAAGKKPALCAELPESGLIEKCRQALATIAGDRAAVGSLSELAFYRDPSARPERVARAGDACREPGFWEPAEDICRLERARRRGATERCQGFDNPELENLCRTIVRP